MNVLLIGNGFDIYYKLPTKYSNFLHTVEFLIKHNTNNIKTIGDVFSDSFFRNCDSFIYECYEKHKHIYNNTELDKEKIGKIISLTKDNVWFNYLLSSFDKDIGWIDFEKEIANVVKAFYEFFQQKNNIQFRIYKLFPNDILYILNYFGFFFERTDTEVLGGSTHKVKPEYIINYPSGSSNQMVNKSKIIKELSEKLNSLTNALKIYLDCFIENTIASISSEDDFEPYKAFDYINRTITFNYTKTFEKLYSNTECFHIHGEINNDIVLGINPDKYDELETVDTSFISFKKYFQRSKYETDLEYLKWTRELKKDVDYYALIVMGHSLDKTDKDIIQEMFSHANPIYVFYHSQEAKESYISNLIDIFGLDKYGYLRKEKQLTFLPLNGDFSGLIENTDDRTIAKFYDRFC